MGTALLSLQSDFAASTAPRVIRYPAGAITYHADSTDTGGQFALLEMDAKPGVEPPLHVHRHEDELFYVLEGELKVYRGAEEITLNPGDSGFLPRNVPHTFKIVSPRARFLVYLTPGGFEAYFRDVAEVMKNAEPGQPLPVPEMLGIAGRYGLTFMP
jgi:quercetin dioxygenase-like cupin family protein